MTIINTMRCDQCGYSIHETQPRIEVEISGKRPIGDWAPGVATATETKHYHAKACWPTAAEMLASLLAKETARIVLDYRDA